MAFAGAAKPPGDSARLAPRSYETAVASRQALLDRHPDLADSLARLIIEQDHFDSATVPLLDAALSAETGVEQATTVAPDGAQTVSTSPADGSPARDDPPRLGPDSAMTCFGDYELLGELARGGMGIVYRARQRSLNRLVALKMILGGRHASSDALQRFKNEAEAAGNLDHPHIVPVYDVGEHDGYRYLAMKLIDGPSLSQLVGSGEWEVRSRDTGRRASGLISTVARAVHHAHQRGVLHRDLKPSNILLDAQGQPYVTDFGLAKRVGGDVELTQSGAILGSPPYMAAEQAGGSRGAVTTATDVYGLGAVLYALLTGRPPFQADSVLETIEKVKACEPEPPSTINPTIDRDLQTICLKCLQKDPQRRYASAQELAEDLERWEGGEPIAARPVTRAERAWRWCRRNPYLAALSGSVTVLLVGSIAGLIVATMLIAREQRQTAKNLQLARQAIEEYLTKVSESRLLEEPGLQPLRKELLESALTYYQSLMSQRVDDRGLRSDLGQAHMRVGAIKSLLGEYAEALNAYRTALEIYRDLAPEDSAANRTQTFQADALREMGIQYLALGDAAAAQTHIAQAVAIGERFVQAKPADEERQNRLAGYYLDLGTAQSGTGDLAAAERSFRQSVAIQERIVAAHPDIANRLQGLAKSQSALVNALRVTGRLGDAQATAAGLIQSYEAVISAGHGSSSDQYELARGLMTFGVLQRDSGHSIEARRSHRRAAGLLESLVAANPRVVRYRALLGAVCVALTGAELQGPRNTKEEFDEELLAGRRAIEIFGDLAKAEPDVLEHRERLVACYNNLSILHRKNDNPDEAIACQRKALEIGEPKVATRAGLLLVGPTLSHVLLNLAEQEILRGDWAAARPLFERHRDLLTRLIAEIPRVPDFRDQLRIALFRLSRMDLGAGRLGEAERDSRRVLDLGAEILRDNPDLALLPPRMTRLARFGSEHRDLADVLQAQGRIPEAISFYSKGISILEDAIRRQPLDVNAPIWLAQLREARAKAQARVGESSGGRGTGAGDRPRPAP